MLRALRSGNFLISLHALKRMEERLVTKRDVMMCGRTATSFRYQADKDTFLIVGKDVDGNDLSVVCGVDWGVIIVTVF